MNMSRLLPRLPILSDAETMWNKMTIHFQVHQLMLFIQQANSTTHDRKNIASITDLKLDADELPRLMLYNFIIPFITSNCYRLSDYSVTFFIRLSCAPLCDDMSSLIRREAAISLNVGLINPSSHSIRCHAQFIHRAVYSIGKQSVYDLTLISVNRTFSFVFKVWNHWAITTEFMYILRLRFQVHKTWKKQVFFSYIGNLWTLISDQRIMVHTYLNSLKKTIKYGWTLALQPHHNPSTRLNCSRAQSMNQPFSLISTIWLSPQQP